MAERGQGFLSGWKGNLPQRVGRAFVQGIFPGNQRAPDGTLNNRAVLGGAAGLAGTIVAGATGIPGAAVAARGIASNMVDGKGFSLSPSPDSIIGRVLGFNQGPGAPQAQSIPVYNPGMSIGGYQGGVTYPSMNLGFGGPSQMGGIVGNRMDAGVGRQLDATLARNEDRIGAELSANLASGKQNRSGQPNGNVMWRPGELMNTQNGNRAFMDQLSRQAAMGQSPYNRRA